MTQAMTQHDLFSSTLPTDGRRRAWNFGAGPAALPEQVLEAVRRDLPLFGDSGMSVLEIGHRTRHYDEVQAKAESLLRQLLGIPETHAVLFLAGGARMQFVMAPMNLLLPGRPADVVHTGVWTKTALADIEKIGAARVVASSSQDNFAHIPRLERSAFSPEASYVHICANNTIYGTQYREFPDTGDVPLVADMTSEILSREIPSGRFGLFFASSQKNLGAAGITVAVIRKDLLERSSAKLPGMLSYKEHSKAGSRLNTPPVFAVYVMGLVLEWVRSQGGVANFERASNLKSLMLYDLIDRSGFYTAPARKEDRSTQNIVFHIRGGDEALEKKFASDAEAAGFVGLEGHRSAGGLRASIYNAVSVEAVAALAEFMTSFQRKFA
jgi:phosphoserine aminotransferase